MNQDDTSRTQARYDRIAPIYDLMEAVVERAAFRRWRRDLWRQVDGGRVLEVGVGTGKNMPYHPPGARMTGIDISRKMLKRAEVRADDGMADVSLALMDAEHLGFPDAAFDAAVATFVFCSVPDPVRGLKEMNRVLKPGARALFLEHVRVNVPVVGELMDLVDPLVMRLMGPHINRRTGQNVEKGGFEIERVRELTAGGLVKLIVGRSKLRKESDRGTPGGRSR